MLRYLFPAGLFFLLRWHMAPTQFAIPVEQGCRRCEASAIQIRQTSLRDVDPGGQEPGVKTPGYLESSLRDAVAAALEFVLHQFHTAPSGAPTDAGMPRRLL